MITQPNPHIEARPATPEVQHRPHLHLPGWAHLRPAPKNIKTTDVQSLNIAFAGLQILIGYEWLLAGGDKFLLGAFPAQLGGLLQTLVKGGHLVGFFAALLLGLVAPNAVLFGYLIELGETLAGQKRPFDCPFHPRRDRDPVRVTLRRLRLWCGRSL